MKKVLLASTALVAFAGVAAAEVTITGSAEMGVAGATFDIDTSAPGVDDFSADEPLQFFQDVDVTFTMSGETDGGLAFGVSVDLDEGGDGSDASDNSFEDGGVAVFISGQFGTLTMGDTDGALDRVLTEAGNIGNPGSINDAETVHIGYNGDYLDGSGDGQIVRYDYTFQQFQFAVSIEQHPSGDGLVLEDDDDLTWAIGFGYEFDFAGGSVDLGIGYQYSDAGSIGIVVATEEDLGIDVDGDGEADDDIGLPLPGGGTLGDDVGEVGATGVGAVVNLDNGFSAGFTYTLFDIDDVDDELTHIGIGAGYSFDAFSVHFNYGQYSIDDADLTGYGLAAGYDLGGGASLLFGYGASQTDDFDFDGDGDDDDFDSSTYSLGLSFSF